MKHKTFYYIILLVMLLVSACGGSGDDSGIPPTEMTITSEGVEDITQPLPVGTVIRFVAHFVPSNTTETGVGWVSSNPSVASIDENGELKLLDNGVAVVTAVSIGNPTLTWSITVNVKDGNIQISDDNQIGQNEAE